MPKFIRCIEIKEAISKISTWKFQGFVKKEVEFVGVTQKHGCSNRFNMEMEAEFLTKNLVYLNLNISRTKISRNKLYKVLE